MSDHKSYQPEVRYRLLTSDGVHLRLYRYRSNGAGRTPVLFLHGASGSHLTFTHPNGGLANYLYDEAHCDPWMLDWRSSGLIVDNTENKATLTSQGHIYNFNRAAKYDIRTALACMAKAKVSFPISMLGHCMGSGTLAEAVALGHISSKHVRSVVLMTLGLFYEVSIDGQLKSEDRVLERFKNPTNDGTIAPFIIDPRFTIRPLELKNKWADELTKLYLAWPDALKAHAEPSSRTACEAIHGMCNRMAFMYGMIYQHGNLHPTIHGDPKSPGSLHRLFGAIPLQMFRHGANNIRQRQATFFDGEAGSNHKFSSDDPHDSGFLSEVPDDAGARHERGKADKSDPNDSRCPSKDVEHSRLLCEYSDAGRFLCEHAHHRYLELLNNGGRVTLITGALNRLWHRDSIDLMYEWLRRGVPLRAEVCVKHIMPTYGHQDLLWGTNSKCDVFPKIAAALIK